jgi:malate dehydrogenase
MPAPIRVAVTGAAGNIGYSLLWRIAAGDVFGADQPVILQLLEITPGLPRLEGTVMEMIDSAFPLVRDFVVTDNAETAFDGIEAAFLVGSRPRTAGMDRADLVLANGPIFVGQGQALAAKAKPNVKVLVVGNPCNTNAMIAQHAAKGLSPRNFTAMTRLDQNRATGQLARKAGVPNSAVSGLVIWGNHADKMYPDVTRATINGKAVESVFDREYLRGEFIKTVATRGKAVIDARGASSAASAAAAAVDHMRDWHRGEGIVSMGIPSEGWYGVPKGLNFSIPCRVQDGDYTPITDIEIDDFAKAKIAENVADLEAERTAVSALLG